MSLRLWAWQASADHGAALRSLLVLVVCPCGQAGDGRSGERSGAMTGRKPHAPPPKSGHKQPCDCLRCANDRWSRGVRPLPIRIGGHVIETLPPEPAAASREATA
jgi:hypothetical protein